MSHGSVERDYNGIAALVIFLFFGLLSLCGMEFADTAGKGELNEGSTAHKGH